MKDIRELFLFFLILINILGTISIDLVLYDENFSCLDNNDKFIILLINIAPMFFCLILIVDFFLYNCYGCMNCLCSNCICLDCGCGSCNCDCDCKDCNCDDCECNCEKEDEDKDDDGKGALALLLIMIIIVAAVIALVIVGLIIYLLTKKVGKKYSRRIALSVISLFGLAISIYCTYLYLDDTEINKDYIIIIGISGFLSFINFLGILLPNFFYCCDANNYGNRESDGSIIVQPLVKAENENDRVKNEESKDFDNIPVPDNNYNSEAIMPFEQPYWSTNNK